MYSYSTVTLTIVHMGHRGFFVESLPEIQLPISRSWPPAGGTDMRAWSPTEEEGRCTWHWLMRPSGILMIPCSWQPDTWLTPDSSSFSPVCWDENRSLSIYVTAWHWLSWHRHYEENPESVDSWRKNYIVRHFLTTLLMVEDHLVVFTVLPYISSLPRVAGMLFQTRNSQTIPLAFLYVPDKMML